MTGVFTGGHRGLLMCVVCALFCAPAAFGQAASGPESILRAYEQNFTRSGLAAKAEILLDAATDEQAALFVGPLYEFALDFVTRNSELLGDDPQMINLAVITVEGAGKAGHPGSVASLWGVFSQYRNTLVRVEVLRALGELGKGNSEASANINQYLAEQNTLRRSFSDVDVPVVSACIETLAILADGSSFMPLFGATVAGYPASISEQALGALNSLPGDYALFLTDVLRAGTPAEKLAALNAGIDNSRLSPAEQGRLAEIAMEEALRFVPANSEEKGIIARLAYSAALALTKLKWAAASGCAVQFFYRAQNDFHQGQVPKEHFVESINCLGAMGTSEAAAPAVLLLGLINAQTERSGAYDADVTIALIAALGNIGDKIAFDHLSRITHLPYSDSVKAAAQEAVERLKW